MAQVQSNIWLSEEAKNMLAVWAKTEGTQNAVIERLIIEEAARKNGEVIEQKSLPALREIVQTEFKKALAQQRMDIREDMSLEFTNEIKAIHRASNHRIAGLIVRTVRDASIIRRLSYALLARSFGQDFAKTIYDDAQEKAGKELTKREGEEV